MKQDVQQPSGLRRAHFALFVLVIAYTFSFIDRTILSLLVEPIQRDLAIGDTELSLLHGLAFALFYTLLGIPIARLADRRSRRGIIAVGVAVWSLATAACGLARSFVELFLARIVVGVGEAALSPAAYSLITDLYPRRKLGTALAVYQVGLYLGAGLAFIIGGAIIAVAMQSDEIVLPIVGALRSWQLVFILVGLPGLAIALLVLTLPEPREHLAARTSAQTVPSIGEVYAFMRRHRRVYVGHFVGFSLIGLVFNGYMAWLPTLFVRRFAWEQAETGQWLGLAVLVFGTLGIVSGGMAADRMLARGRNDAAVRSGMLGSIGMLPFALVAPLVEDANLALLVLCGFFFFSSFPYAGAATALQMVSPPRMRAQASAIFLFVLNLMGIGLGPTVVALGTDFIFADSMAVNLSLVATAALLAPLGIAVLALTLKPYALLAEQNRKDAIAS